VVGARRVSYPDRYAIVGFGGRVFEVSETAHVVVSGLGFHATSAPLAGGVILNRGSLSVSDSEFATNNVTPAIDPELGVERSMGGAIYNIGSLTVTRSHFGGNRANQGGGIYNGGTLTVINSSFVYNSNSAIFNAGALTLTNSTLTHNPGIGLWQTGGSLRSKNSIVADNPGGNCETDGPVSIVGVNLDTDGTCPHFGHVAPETLRFGSLERIAELQEGSVAIDAVADCTLHDGVTPVVTDERGFVRPQGAFCDVGSFEFVRPFTFTGFFAPLHNQSLNALKAGRTVAVKFSLAGDRGPGIFAPGFPASQQVECDRSSDSSAVDETMVPDSSGLSYDVGSDTYTYLWQTEGNWTNTCRDLTLRFVDGSTQQVRFRFHK
jgi:hypothetical protein